MDSRGVYSIAGGLGRRLARSTSTSTSTSASGLVNDRSDIVYTISFGPDSFLFRRTWYLDVFPMVITPWCLICSNQNGVFAAVVSLQEAVVKGTVSLIDLDTLARKETMVHQASENTHREAIWHEYQYLLTGHHF